MLHFLLNVTVQSVVLAAIGWVGTRVLCVRSAAARHAVWTAVVAGMLLSALLSRVLPALPLRVLPAPPIAANQTGSQLGASVQAALIDHQARRPAGNVLARSHPVLSWQQVAIAIYAAVAVVLLLRLALGYFFTLRLVRRSRPADGLLESDWISVPMTVGWLRPRILLPAGWRGWPAEKLDAVLAHERAHIRRADWAIAAMAALNRCVFWFNPIGWILERRLALLAEQACDDAALFGSLRRDLYARFLLELAAAVRTSRGRLNWEAMAMAKPSELRQRIERILDETRSIPRELTRTTRVALSVGALTTACLLGAVQLTPVPAKQSAQEQMASAKATLSRQQTLTDVEVARLENAVAANPGEMDSRVRLIYYYTNNAKVQQRDAHILWVIEHHPEYDSSKYPGLMTFGSPGSLEDVAADERAAQLWERQATAYPNDTRVIRNAAQFLDLYYGSRNKLFEAEGWIKRAIDLAPVLRLRLAGIYGGAIISAAGGQGPFLDSAFAAHARAELDASNDGQILWNAGYALARAKSRDGQPLVGLVAYGQQLQKRAVEQLGYKPPPMPTEAAQATAAAILREAQFGPEPIKRVGPVYPLVAQQARVQATVRLRVLIGTDGRVEQVEPISGHPMLVPAARDAVKQWIYPPQREETLVEVDVPFQLSNENPLPDSRLPEREDANLAPA